MIAPGLYPWAYATSTEYTLELLSRLEKALERKVGAVLYPSNYGVAELRPGPYLAYARNPDHARAVPPGVEGIIAGDEPNGGTTSANVPPSTYAARYNRIADAAPSSVPVLRAGLAYLGGFWRTLLVRRYFDARYHAALDRILPGTPSSANAIRTTRAGISGAPVDLVTVAPFVKQGVGATFTASIERGVNGVTPHYLLGLASSRPVALWALRQTPHQTQHSLFSPSEDFTELGRAFVRAAS